MPIKKSLYETAEHSRDDIKNKGFDYHGRIFEKTMSSLIFREEKRSGILASLEEIYYEMIQRVKTIKLHFDYAKKKNYRDFN
jgi:hypothetical protein